MSIKNELDKEILEEIEGLKELTIGSEEHEVAVNSLAKLLDRSLDIDKLDVEYAGQENEMELKTQQAKDEKKDRLVKNVLTGVSVIGGFALTIWGTCKSIKFEETGTFTTIMGRGFINKLLPKK